MFKISECCVPFPTPVSLWNFLLLLKILPAGSDTYCIPTTGWHLCCSAANPSSRLPLSVRQAVCFDTPHKQRLQAN